MTHPSPASAIGVAKLSRSQSRALLRPWTALSWSFGAMSGDHHGGAPDASQWRERCGSGADGLRTGVQAAMGSLFRSSRPRSAMVDTESDLSRCVIICVRMCM